MALQEDIVSLLGRRGVLTGGELLRALDISAPTLSRRVRSGADRILRMGRTRGARYATYRNVAGIPSRLPVYRVDVKGASSRVATLHLLALGQHWLEAEAGPDAFFSGLPPVAGDMAPQGFLGRRFSETHADLELPRRMQDWNDDHRLIAIARRGEDCIGDLIFGDESLHQFLDNAPPPISRREYPARSRAAAEGGSGSSAGGERPKFTAQVDARQLIVKFTVGDGSPTDQRWRDLLVCELLALETLNEHGLPAARAQIVDVDTQRFLEMERFDRIGERGRCGVITAGPLDDDLYGQRDNWPAFAERMATDGLLTKEEARRIRLLDAFGQLIGNTDRHFGNLSFFADGLSRKPVMRLAPVYDMVPMVWSPDNDVVPPLDLPIARVRANTLVVWEEATRLAQEFWRRVADDARLGVAFRAAAKVVTDKLNTA